MPDRLGAPAAGPVLILTPTGRDAEAAATLLSAEDIESRIYPTLADLRAALDDTTVLTQAARAARRQMAELNLPDKLGNLIFLERPLNVLSLISAVRLALRARRRQRQVR